MKRILPYILATLTQTNRYKPEMQWSKSFIYNLFRIYEQIFWRREGVRPESTKYSDEQGKETYYFYTLESALVHLEGMIKNAFKVKWIPVEIFVPAFASDPQFRRQNPFLFAIAFDNSGQGAFGTSPRSFSYTVTGSNTIMTGCTITDNATQTGFTYNSVSLTSIADAPTNASRKTVQSSYLINPTTGSNTVSATASTSLGVMVSTYSGAKQSGQPDSFNTKDQTSADTSLTIATTVVLPNCWIVVHSCDDQGSGYTGSGGSAVRQTSAQGALLGDSNATVATGSVTTTFSRSGANIKYGAVAFSIAPFASPVNSSFLMFM